MSAEHELEHGLLAEAVGNDFSLRCSSTNIRSRKFVVRTKGRCVTGSRRCAMQASKSSSKQTSALGRRSAQPARVPSASRRAIDLEAPDRCGDARLEFRAWICRDLREIAHANAPRSADAPSAESIRRSPGLSAARADHEQRSPRPLARRSRRTPALPRGPPMSPAAICVRPLRPPGGRTASRHGPGRSRPAMPSANEQTMACSERSRLHKSLTRPTAVL